MRHLSKLSSRHKWQKALQDLYTCTGNSQLESGHHDLCLAHKATLKNVTESLYDFNQTLNENIIFVEVECTVRNAKVTLALLQMIF